MGVDCFEGRDVDWVRGVEVEGLRWEGFELEVDCLEGISRGYIVAKGRGSRQRTDLRL